MATETSPKSPLIISTPPLQTRHAGSTPATLSAPAQQTGSRTAAPPAPEPPSSQAAQRQKELATHIGLGAVGLVPGPVGAVANTADGVVYLKEKDYKNAGLSFGVAAAEFIPNPAGEATAVAKFIKRTSETVLSF